MDESADDIHCILWSLSIIDEMLEAHGDSYLQRQSLYQYYYYSVLLDRRTDGKEQYYYYYSILLNRRTGEGKHSRWRTISLWTKIQLPLLLLLLLNTRTGGGGAGKNPARNPAPPGFPTPYVALRFWPMLFVLRRNNIGPDLYVICSEKK